MSRTIRRKNIEDTYGNSWNRRGRKAGGFYSTYDDRKPVKVRWTKRTQYEEDGMIFVECRTGWTWKYDCPVYRPMTDQERNERFWNLHGESSSANAWTPCRWFRQNRERELRTHNKQELIKYMKNPENYEPMVFEEPMSHYWDWS